MSSTHALHRAAGTGSAPMFGKEGDCSKVGEANIMANNLPLLHVARHVLELHFNVCRLGAFHLARIQRLLSQPAPLAQHQLRPLGLRERQLLDARRQCGVDVFRGALGEEVVELVCQVRVARHIRFLHTVSAILVTAWRRQVAELIGRAGKGGGQVRTMEAKRWYATCTNETRKSTKVIVDDAVLSSLRSSAAGEAATAVKMSSRRSPVNLPNGALAAVQNALNWVKFNLLIVCGSFSPCKQ